MSAVFARDLRRKRKDVLYFVNYFCGHVLKMHTILNIYSYNYTRYQVSDRLTARTYMVVDSFKFDEKLGRGWVCGKLSADHCLCIARVTELQIQSGFCWHLTGFNNSQRVLYGNYQVEIYIDSCISVSQLFLVRSNNSNVYQFPLDNFHTGPFNY